MQKKNFIGFRDRILLHLLRFEKEVYENIHGGDVDGSYKEFLINLTQEGIADSVGTKQSTIYKELQTLRTPAIAGEEPLILMLDKVRIPGKERACSVYFLSNYGHDLAEQKKKYIEDKNLEMVDQRDKLDKIITIKDLSNRLLAEDYESNYINAILRVAAAVTFNGKINWSELVKPQTRVEPQIIGISKTIPTKTIALKTLQKVENPYFNRIAIKDPQYFFGRLEEIQYLISLLRNCQSCSIVGPRRSGKSSLINYISHIDALTKYNLNPEDYIFVPIDLEGLGELTQSEFFTMIIEEIRNRTNNSNLRGSIEKLLTQEEVRFLDIKNIMREITNLNKNVIFLFDEFELITNNKNLDCNFYSGLRNLANTFNVAYITSSHVPLLDLTLSQETLGSPFFNFFTQIELGLLDDKGVNDLITIPSQNNGIVFPKNVIEFVKNTAGSHAFFIQILCYHTFQWLIDKGSISDNNLIELKDIFLSEARSHFQYFWNHLSEPEQNVLTTLCAEPEVNLSDLDKPLLKGLAKKTILTFKNERYEIFSNSFGEFITRLDKKSILEPTITIITEPKDVIEDSILPRKQTISLEWGSSYFIDEYSPEFSLKIFKAIVDQNTNGLFITRTEPQKAGEQWKLLNSKIIWLCSRSGSGCLPPALEKISHTVNEFINNNPNSVVYLDGLEFIVNNNDFLKTLSLIDNLKENIAIKRSILLFPISSTIFSEKEIALLGKNSIRIKKEHDLNYSNILENK